jgi:Rieske Fe-S protein
MAWGADSRRGFLKVATAALGALTGAVAAVPGLAFLAHPLRSRTVTGEGEPTKVARAGDLKPGQPLRVVVRGTRRDGWLRQDAIQLGACWLVPGEGERVRALSTVCPHLGCGIDWNGAAGRFECPCHGSVFDPNGTCTAGPSPRPMDELAVSRRGDDLLVTYRRFRVATAKKEPLA